MGIEIKVTPTRKLFFNSDNYFGIYGCNVSEEDKDKVTINHYGNISIKGEMPELDIDAEYEVTLVEDTKSQYAGSYLVQSIKRKRAETLDEQKDFLKTILTPNQLENIYSVYSEDADIVGMIEKNEFDYSKVKGLGDKTYEKLKEKILDNVDMSDALKFLSKFGIKYNMISKLVRQYGNQEIVIEKVKNNPYVLTELPNIGFLTADDIAVAIGFDMKSSHRIKSAIEYVLEQEAQSGHSWIEEKGLLNKAVDLLNIDRSAIQYVLDFDNLGRVINVDEKYALKNVYEAEKYIAERVIQHSQNKNKVFDTEELDSMIDEYSKEHGFELEENQRKFFHDWNENGVNVLIGYGGSGKSWLQNILLNLIDPLGLRIALLAPTGK